MATAFANSVFLAWVRQGLAGIVSRPDPLPKPLPTAAAIAVGLDVNGVRVISRSVKLFGPGEVIGIDPRQVVRTEPPRGSSDYESNNLAAIEFDSPDLPWLFTPAAANAQGQLRPWLCLVVVRKQEGVRFRAARDEVLPVLEIVPPAKPADELPDLSESWAWAHAQVGTVKGATEDVVRGVFEARPELAVSRLLSPRLLSSFTDYIACVVPAFEAGRLAGLNQPLTPDAKKELSAAWASGSGAPPAVSLPVYYHWEFRTGEREDFESLVDQLVPRDLSGVVGRRPMDISRPGFVVKDSKVTEAALEGALQPVKLSRAAWPDETSKGWRDTLMGIVNAGNARLASGDPVVGPPIYGRWTAQRHAVGSITPPTWLDELNLDPRDRVSAALGTQVIQQQQEALVAQAWEQAGELPSVNQRLRQMQLSLLIAKNVHRRQVIRLTDLDATWRFVSPMQGRLPGLAIAASPPTPPPPGSPPSPPPAPPTITMRQTLTRSWIPPSVTSPAMRRMVRPNGPIGRRCMAAAQASGSSQQRALLSLNRIGSLFSKFDAKTGFKPTPKRVLSMVKSWVSVDAVTTALNDPKYTGAIRFNQTSWNAVHNGPKLPGFRIGAVPAAMRDAPPPTIDAPLSGGSAMPSSEMSGERAQAVPPAPVRLPPSPLPPIPPIPPPVPPPPPKVDSADAKAFRAAAERHLLKVHPPRTQPFRIPPDDLMGTARAVHSALDPTRVWKRRMAATILLHGKPPAPTDALAPYGHTPVFPQPMSDALAALSQDWLLPGLEGVPVNTVALLEPNQRFIEAFMVGLNVEMGRELLWRDFPIQSERATYFYWFWHRLPARNNQDTRDIPEIAGWNRALGYNTVGPIAQRRVVLLIRGKLLRRYPGAAIYAVRGKYTGQYRAPSTTETDELFPVFRGSLQPDVTFFGFDLGDDEAKGDGTKNKPGWYFVIQEQPTEPRFGFDVQVDFGGASHVLLRDPLPAGLDRLPSGAVWNSNSAHVALITRQQPIRVAIHANQLLGS